MHKHTHTHSHTHTHTQTHTHTHTHIRTHTCTHTMLDFMSGALLKRVVTTTNDLGVMFDTKLSFSMHCNYLANKGYMRSNLE